ncbi:MAG TPA: hypothetical protein VN734_13320 [Acidobacteriaceae bacterium]|nr:hypothetical protein [Acidobacteriaceae bacterium]
MAPTLQGYISFLTNVVQVSMGNLPPFSGSGTLVAGSTTLTIASVTTGELFENAIVTDANGSIPTNPATTVTGPLSPNPAVGIGTYTMSSAAVTDQATPEAITATNQWIVATFSVAMDTVNDTIAAADCSGRTYSFAVYNLATDRLVNWAPDVLGQTYFQDLRTDMRLDRPTLGVVSSAADQGSSGSILNPEFLRNLTASDLQTLRTPWGRTYIGIAQDFGPSLFGVS